MRYNRITGIPKRPVGKIPDELKPVFARFKKEGLYMNYLTWSMEYTQTAEELAKVIEKLKTARTCASPSQKKELDQKLALFRSYYRECIQTAALLKERHRDAA